MQPPVVRAAAPPPANRPRSAMTCAVVPPSSRASPSRPSVGQREVGGLLLGHVLRAISAGGRVVVPLSIAVGSVRRVPRLVVGFVVDARPKPVARICVSPRQRPGPQSTWGTGRYQTPILLRRLGHSQNDWEDTQGRHYLPLLYPAPSPSARMSCPTSSSVGLMLSRRFTIMSVYAVCVTSPYIGFPLSITLV